MSFLDIEESKKEKNRLKLIFPQIYPRRRKRIKIEKKKNNLIQNKQLKIETTIDMK